MEAGIGFERMSGFITRAMEVLKISTVEIDGDSRAEKFDVEMNNDFGVPNAIAVIHEVVRAANSKLAENDTEAVRAALVSVVSNARCARHEPTRCAMGTRAVQ